MRKGFIVTLLILFGWTVPVLAADDTVLATIGDTKITMADFEKIVGYFDAKQRAALEQAPQLKAALLEQIVKSIVVAKIARENGFDKQEDMRWKIAFLTDNALTDEYLKVLMAKTDTSDETLKAYYDSHLDEFKTAESVRVRHILIKVEEAASESAKKPARDRAEEILQKVRAGEDFAKLAKEYSQDPVSKAKGGDLGFIQKGRMVPEFEKVAFSLKPGEVSDIVETVSGFHIIKGEQKKEPVQEPFDKVREAVKEKVRRASVDKFAQQAIKDAKVQINLEPLKPKKKGS